MLVTLARTGSIAAASLELHVTQQAVSARLQRLERLVGAPMARRGNRDTTLTAEGLRVAEWASEVLRAAEQFDAAMTSLPGSRGTRLNVAASLTVAEFFLPHWIVRFRARRIALGDEIAVIDVEATNAARVTSMVADGTVELGFVEGTSSPAGLRYRELAQDELVLVTAPQHEWARRGDRAVDNTELARTPLVMREFGSGCRAVLVSALHRAGVAPGVVVAPLLELPSNTAIAETVAGGVGAAAITVHAVQHLLNEGRLVRIRTPELDLRRRLGATWRGGREPAGPLARELLEASGAGQQPVPPSPSARAGQHRAAPGS